jgi:hypothetical protein
MNALGILALLLLGGFAPEPRIEVLGLAEVPAQGEARWWGADGKWLKKAPLALAPRPTSGSRPNGVRPLWMVLKLSGPGALRQVSATFDGGKKLAPQAFALSYPPRSPGLVLVAFSAPDGAKTASFQLGLRSSTPTERTETVEITSIPLRPGAE